MLYKYTRYHTWGPNSHCLTLCRWFIIISYQPHHKRTWSPYLNLGKYYGIYLILTKVSTSALAGMLKNLPFKLSVDSFTFFGVKVTKSYYSVFKGNFTLLIEHCKKDIKQWSILPLSLIGRTNSVKMNTVPKFLFLFQAIPTFIPQSFFKEFSQMISSFIWNIIYTVSLHKERIYGKT